MKFLFSILFAVITLSATAQAPNLTWGKRVWATQQFQLKTESVTDISHDSADASNSKTKLMSELAIKGYVRQKTKTFSFDSTLRWIEPGAVFGVDTSKMATRNWVLAQIAAGGGGSGGSGGVSSFSFTNTTGITGTVTNSTSTPALSLAIDSAAILNFYTKVRAAQNTYNLDLNTVLGNGNSATGKSMTLNSSTNAGAFAFINANTPNLNLYRSDWARVIASTTTPMVEIYGLSSASVDSSRVQLYGNGLNYIYNTTTLAAINIVRKNFKLFSDSLTWINSNGTAKSTIFDTVSYKPLQINGAGNITRAQFWPSSPVFDSSSISNRINAKASLSGDTFTGSVGIGTSANSSAILDVSSTSKGILIPRVTTTQRDAISSPATNLMAINTSTGSLDMFNGNSWNPIAGLNTDWVEEVQLLGSTIKAAPSGIETMNTANVLNSGRSYFTAFRVRKAITISSIGWYQAAQGVYVATGSTGFNGVALYSYSGGTMTLIDSSARDTTIWKATSNTWQSKTLSQGSQTLQPGIYLAFGLYSSVSQTTAPSLGIITAGTSNYGAPFMTNSARLFGGVASGVTIPPSSAAISTLSGVAIKVGFVLL